MSELNVDQLRHWYSMSQQGSPAAAAAKALIEKRSEAPSGWENYPQAQHVDENLPVPVKRRPIGKIPLVNF